MINATARVHGRFRKVVYFEFSGLFLIMLVVRVVAWRGPRLAYVTGEGPATPGPLWIYLLPIVVLAIAFTALYLPWLRALYRREDAETHNPQTHNPQALDAGASGIASPQDHRGWLFIACVIAASVGLGAVHLDGSFALALLFLCFIAWDVFPGPRWHGLVMILSGAAVVVVTLWTLYGSDHPQWHDALITLAFNIGIGTAIGLWWASDERQSLANARLVDQLQHAQTLMATQQHAAGVMAERERVAREIHDTLAQGFTTTLMLTQDAERALSRGDLDTVKARHTLVEQVARDNIAEARALVAAFAPAPLHGSTLCDALQRVCERWSAEQGIPVTATIGTVEGLSAEVEVALLRAAQEALTNVGKHAQATGVTVSLGGRPDLGVRLSVADNGVGMGDAPEGFGLTGMRARVAEAGGSVHVVQSPGGGTTVRVDFLSAWSGVHNRGGDSVQDRVENGAQTNALDGTQGSAMNRPLGRTQTRGGNS